MCENECLSTLIQETRKYHFLPTNVLVVRNIRTATHSLLITCPFVCYSFCSLNQTILWATSCTVHFMHSCTHISTTAASQREKDIGKGYTLQHTTHNKSVMPEVNGCTKQRRRAQSPAVTENKPSTAYTVITVRGNKY